GGDRPTPQGDARPDRGAGRSESQAGPRVPTKVLAALIAVILEDSHGYTTRPSRRTGGSSSLRPVAAAGGRLTHGVLRRAPRHRKEPAGPSTRAPGGGGRAHRAPAAVGRRAARLRSQRP